MINLRFRYFTIYTSVYFILMSGSGNLARGADSEIIQYETSNSIPNVVFPRSPVQNPKERLKIFIKPFRSDAPHLPFNTTNIALDRLEVIIGGLDRCKIYDEGSETNCDYTLEGIIRSFQVTQYKSTTEGGAKELMRSLVMMAGKTKGLPVEELEKVDWSSTNTIVEVDCELSLKLKRQQDKELIKTVAGQFSRTTMVKNLVAELAGITFAQGKQRIPDAANQADAADANFVKGKIIQVALANAMVQLVAAIDEEIQANRTITPSK